MTNNHQNDKYFIREQLKQQIKEKQGWYFITFAKELPSTRPYGFTLFKEPFVLLKDSNAKLICYSLSLLSENNQPEIKSFKVIEKQGEVWLWRGSLG